MNRSPLTQQQSFDLRTQRIESGCLVWTGAIRVHNYGSFYIRQEKRTVFAHRWAYEQVNGPIPAGLQIDHLCMNPRCVEPEHLEAVTPRTNTLRGNNPAAVNARKTHCNNGHPLDENRRCQICQRATWRRYKRRRALEAEE